MITLTNLANFFKVAVLFVFISSSNFMMFGLLSKYGFMNLRRSIEKNGHLSRAWNSSPTSELQKWHFLSDVVIFSHLPRSTGNLWFKHKCS